MSAAFEDLPLHDAVLDEVRVHWEARRCEVLLSAFVVRGERAEPHLLAFTGVTRVVVPSEAPWGPSVFVNGTRRGDDGSYLVELQSGDVIEIRAKSFCFEPGPRSPGPSPG